MKFFQSIMVMTGTILLACMPGVLAATTAAPPMAAPVGLSLLELKITGDEYVLLQNNSAVAIADLSTYWLNSFNNVNPLAAGVSSSSQQLPVASLLPHQTLLLSANPMQTCGASVAGKLSLSLGDSGGFLQLTRVGLSGEGAIAQTAGDFVSWSSGASGLIPNVPSSTKSPRAAFYRYFNGNSHVWQLADLDTSDSCQLNIVVAGGSGSSSAVTPLTLAATSPPATIMGVLSDSSGAAMLPPADIGLTAPQLSELLPNPVGTGNDATDEFIELYNPNDKPFDLSGFILQTGITSLKTHVFAADTSIAAKSFKAFYPPETKLSLSSTSSQVVLFDPMGNVLAQSDAYRSAKDGIAWANAQGKWQWTSQPTPGIANIIRTPVAKTTKSKAKKPLTKKVAVKGAGDKAAAVSSSNFQEEAASSTVHTWVLALIGGVALLYGAYEYRRDLANRLFKLRAKLGIGRKARAENTGADND